MKERTVAFEQEMQQYFLLGKNSKKNLNYKSKNKIT